MKTRDGSKVEITDPYKENRGRLTIMGKVEGKLAFWTGDGNARLDGLPDPWDLDDETLEAVTMMKLGKQ